MKEKRRKKTPNMAERNRKQPDMANTGINYAYHLTLHIVLSIQVYFWQKILPNIQFIKKSASLAILSHARVFVFKAKLYQIYGRRKTFCISESINEQPALKVHKVSFTKNRLSLRYRLCSLFYVTKQKSSHFVPNRKNDVLYVCVVKKTRKRRFYLWE